MEFYLLQYCRLLQVDHTLYLLQHYWWILISVLAGALVFLLFVQGGQSLLYTLGKTKEERDLIVNTLGHKWELTFTTLVVFGGAFFASFPLFYSTSFGGAYVVWMLILFVLSFRLCRLNTGVNPVISWGHARTKYF